MRKSFCLDSVSSFKDIARSPVNRSTSKHLWSFSKESRFPQEKVYCDNIYEIGGLRPHRYGVSIGKGSKSDFTKDLTVSPGSSKYPISSFFDYNKSHKAGYSLGIGREVRANVNVENSSRRSHWVGTPQSSWSWCILKSQNRQRAEIHSEGPHQDAR